MVEPLRKLDAHKWATTISAVMAAAIIIGNMLFGAGGVLATNTAGMNQFGTQLASLSDQVAKLSVKIDAGPRADQILVLDRHLSAQDGRMDSIDTRLRDSENRIAALRAQLDQLDQSSRATLGHR